MTDITLNNIASGYNLSNINNNFEIIEDVINTEVLHTTGGNSVMGQSIDMNTHRILNLPEPTNPTDVVRLQDLEEAIASIDLSGGGGGGSGSGYVSFAEQYIVASAGQSSFTLDYSYLPGSNSLAVYHNGSRLIVDEDFQEASSTTVSLIVPAQDGDEFVFLIGQEASTAISADNVTYSVGAVGYVQRSVQDKLRESVSVKDFGAIGNGVADDTAAINAAATAARASGSALVIPAVSNYYLISGTVDLSDIKVIDGRGAELRGAISGAPAAIIGGSATSFRNADIYLKVRNTADESTTAGTHGIRCLNFSNSKLTLYARGFLNGLYFDGTSSNRVWVDNEVKILELYNNQNQVHFDLAGTSYAVKNQFVGGSWYLGTTLTSTNCGTVKATLAGTSQLADIVIRSPEIGIVRSAIDLASHAVFLYTDVNTSFTTNTIEFQDVRFEGYGSWGSDNPYGINIATNASGRIGVEVEIAGSVPSDSAYTVFQIGQPASKLNKIRLVNKSIRAQGNRAYPQVIIPESVLPYQTSSRCYVPGRIIYDQGTGYATPVDYFSTAFGSNSVSRCVSDGDIISSGTTDSYGLRYSKSTSEVTFIELHTPEQCAVICYDSSGNVLSGTSPYYANGENLRSITRGSVTIYEFSGRWLWLHKNVASFYIGGVRWSSAGKLKDIAFNVLYGAPVEKVNALQMSPRNNVAHTSPIHAFMPLGADMTGTGANGWRNEFYLRTTTSAGASSGASAITATSVTGITNSDTIAIELDTEIATGLRRYQYFTVNSVAGSTVNLNSTLAADVAAGRTVLVNRWVAK